MRAFPERWKVSAPEFIAETVSSRIWKVVREDGSPAIVKDLKPFDDVADDLRGEHFLAWRCGEGAVRLLGREDNRMLLEYAHREDGNAVDENRGLSICRGDPKRSPQLLTAISVGKR